MLNGDMYLEDVVDIDELAMSASELLNQYCKRGINDEIKRRVLNNTHEARNLEKLKGLVAKFEALGLELPQSDGK
jgi:hypothetical protein